MFTDMTGKVKNMMLITGKIGQKRHSNTFSKIIRNIKLYYIKKIFTNFYIFKIHIA